MSDPGSTSGCGGIVAADASTTSRGSRFRELFNGTDSLLASVWLVVLVFPASQLVLSDASVFRKIIGVVLLVLFSVTYSLGFGMAETFPRRMTMPQRALFWFCVLVVVTVPTVLVIGVWSVFLVPFYVAMVSFTVPMIYSLPAVVTIMLASTGAVYLAEPDAVVPTMGATVASPVMIYLVALASRRSEAKSRLAHELSLSQERESIAVDVHDLLGHSLTVVTLKSEVAARLVDTDPEAAKAEMEQITRISRTALAEVRSTVTRMRRPDLDGELAAARRALDTAGVDAVLPSDTSVAGTNSHLFSWVIREAVTNVVRHAEASRCEVTMSGDRVRVVDDGVGFEGAAEGAAEGEGLAGLRARVEDAGGTLTLRSHTTATVTASGTAGTASGTAGTASGTDTATGTGTTLVVSMTGENP
ncbi:MAG: sensor histidine kinase [Corynebacterium variabile]|uniref:sensor histidine kinase n=1 Tax=Corynebacterium variabile TaxID=1727 RepID=UPI003F934B31